MHLPVNGSHEATDNDRARQGQGIVQALLVLEGQGLHLGQGGCWREGERCDGACSRVFITTGGGGAFVPWIGLGATSMPTQWYGDLRWWRTTQ